MSEAKAMHFAATQPISHHMYSDSPGTWSPCVVSARTCGGGQEKLMSGTAGKYQGSSSCFVCLFLNTVWPVYWKISTFLLSQVPPYHHLRHVIYPVLTWLSLGVPPKLGVWGGQDRFYRSQWWFIPLSPFVARNWEQTRRHVPERPLKLSAAPCPHHSSQDF